MLALLLTAALAVVSIAAPPAVTVSISPTFAYIIPTGDRNFKTTVGGAIDKAVTWSTSGGTITATGSYKPPVGAIVGTTYTVTATSVQDPSISATAQVVIANKPATIAAYIPNPATVGTFTLTVSGINFVAGSKIVFNNQTVPTVFNSVNSLSATVTAAAVGSYNLWIQNPGPSATSNTKSVSVVASGGGVIPPPPPPPPAITVTLSPASAGIPVAGSQQFTVTVNNNANQNVTWKVNGKTGGDVTLGLISPTGLYTAPGNPISPNVLTISAVAAADGLTTGSASITIQNPQAISSGRFLDQVTFGATQPDIAHLQQIGMNAYLDEQFAMPASALPPSSGTRTEAIDSFFASKVYGNDQLRQRVIYALSEIIVISMNKNVNGDMVIPWQQIVSNNAFGNYKTLLKQITLDGSMGYFLDMVNSGGAAANENYPREIMQLFSIGLNQLNDDGSLKLDANNQPIPTYSQADVVGLAKAFTGWTYNSPNGTTSSGGNGAYYPGTMLPVPNKHVPGPKTFLGQTIPAGQTIQQDLDSAIDIIFSHANVAPFISTRLIRALVTSNPSPQYINDISDVFNNNGNNIKGDLQAVVRAIITHPEARNDHPGPTFGRLRTPVQFLAATARTLNITWGNASGFNYLLIGMGESILEAPSVFAHYSPLFKIPKGGGLLGPEFQIYSASDAANRANFLYSRLNVYPFNPQIQPYINLAGTPQQLIDAVDNALLFGRMSNTLRNAILNSIPAMPDNNQRAINALYLTALSGEFLVQR